ncbi:hypothetical protein CSOJ01_01480 [Colletotrichum sojae]|uniref:Uncharacterized protein n=1 Tax=Colletotrichum sojae TaxID=2175907 RepID=A0A8H6N4F9_9PEZI|nr:hypothetical protein CSOJ01_01480 [Colletotrichum sojae]
MGDDAVSVFCSLPSAGRVYRLGREASERVQTAVPLGAGCGSWRDPFSPTCHSWKLTPTYWFQNAPTDPKAPTCPSSRLVVNAGTPNGRVVDRRGKRSDPVECEAGSSSEAQKLVPNANDPSQRGGSREPDGGIRAGAWTPAGRGWLIVYSLRSIVVYRAGSNEPDAFATIDPLSQAATTDDRRSELGKVSEDGVVNCHLW